MLRTLFLAVLLVGGAVQGLRAQAPPVRSEVDTRGLPATNYYEIQTPLGRMVVRLSDETPLHRDNFKRLVADGVLDGTRFHRVISGFVIQGGDPLTKDDDPTNDGQGDPGYRLPAEIRPGLFHRRGALAAARQGDAVNPERASSGSQFYIVQGNLLNDTVLDQVEQQLRRAIPDTAFAFSETARAAYKELGGVPFLDGQYTVFGELVEGFDVLDRIAAVETPRRRGEFTAPQLMDQPLEPLAMTLRPLPDYTPPTE